MRNDFKWFAGAVVVSMLSLLVLGFFFDQAEQATTEQFEAVLDEYPHDDTTADCTLPCVYVRQCDRVVLDLDRC